MGGIDGLVSRQAGGGRTPRPVGDFFGPFFTVEFVPVEEGIPEVDEDGNFTKQNTNSLKIFGGASDEIKDNVSKSAASMTAETKAGAPFRFSVTFTPDYHDAIEILDSGIIGYHTIAKVKWGYISQDGSRNETPEHEFRIIFPEAKFGENIQITAGGFDKFSDVVSRQSQIDDYPADGKLSPRGIIERIINISDEENIELRVDDNIKSGHDFLLPIPEKIIQRHTDWAFVLHLLRRLALTFSISAEDGKTIFTVYDPVRPRSEDQDIAYRFLWRLPPAKENDVPVYNIHANYLPSMYQPKEARGVFTIQSNDATGEVTKKLIDGADTETEQPTTENSPEGESNATGFVNLAEGSDQAEAEARSKNKTPGTLLSQPLARPSKSGGVAADNFALSLIKSGQFRSHPMVQLNCPGVVDMRPGLVVELKGATSIFDGLYHVLTVKHSISSSGYDLAVTLIRHVQKTSEPGKKPAGKKKRRLKRVS